MNDLRKLAEEAFNAKYTMARLSTRIKNEVLLKIGEEILKRKEEIMKENEGDVENAKEKGLSKAMIDRLILNEKRINQMVDGLKVVANLPDPVGEIVWGTTRPNGLKIRQIRVPLGLILMIYESRPNVTIDAAGLCFKAGNSVILRGGSESFNSNLILVNIMKDVLDKYNIPSSAISFVPTTSRDAIKELLTYDDLIDVVIPRGGENLIKAVKEQSKIPVIFHYKGVCHIFVDKSAQKDMAERITVNAKTQRPGVCNAAETLLIHKDYPYKKELIQALIEKGVEIRGDKRVKEIFPDVKEATEEDWYTEYLDFIISVKIVDSIEEAIAHINKYGSNHSEAIITENYVNAEKFLEEVDSAAVYVNASTRFTDGGEFGFGAEIGISTQKLHVRGPMALRELTTTKYIVYGNGQIRE